MFNCLSQSLITFVNKHLNKLNLEVTELESQVRQTDFLFSFIFHTCCVPVNI